jgi:hypothetical protein
LFDPERAISLPGVRTPVLERVARYAVNDVVPSTVGLRIENQLQHPEITVSIVTSAIFLHRLKALTRDARSCPADFAQFINQVREAIPSAQDRAMVNSSTLFVQGSFANLN